ncbi:MAG: hypothetical protein K8I82_28945 [Anaerolineae bacterium]|nr:hypothetical protein [Anaerolineae bacterium]
MEVLLALMILLLILIVGLTARRSWYSSLAYPIPPTAHNTFVYLSDVKKYCVTCAVETQYFSQVGEFGLRLSSESTFELWLADPQHRVSKQLFTPTSFYNFYDDNFETVSDHDTFAQAGKVIFLETGSLNLLARILNVRFRGELFEQMTLEAAVWYKEKL